MCIRDSFLSSVAGTRGLVGLMNFLMWFGNTTILLMAAVMGIDPGLYEAEMCIRDRSMRAFVRSGKAQAAAQMLHQRRRVFLPAVKGHLLVQDGRCV